VGCYPLVETFFIKDINTFSITVCAPISSIIKKKKPVEKARRKQEGEMEKTRRRGKWEKVRRK
jgi:hypothetical protein